MVKKERNMKIHLSAAFLVVVLGLLLGISRIEWLVITLIIFMVLAAEMVNSAIEEICDLLVKKLDLKYSETKWVRDMAAGAVLLLAIASVIIGMLVFLPKLLSFGADSCPP